MAEKWCLEYGVLPIEKAQELVDRMQKGVANTNTNNKKKK